MIKQSAALAGIAIVACLLSAPASARADTIFSNFGPGTSYDIFGGNPVGNALDGLGTYAEGGSFTVGSDALFGSLAIALSCAFCPVLDPFQILLETDAGGHPGSALESFTVSTLGSLGTDNPPLLLNSLLNPLLMAGQTYWIVVIADLNDSIAWNWNTTGDSSATGVSTDAGGTWFAPSGFTPGAFEIDSSGAPPVPEPGTLILLGGGLLLVAHHLRKRLP